MASEASSLELGLAQIQSDLTNTPLYDSKLYEQTIPQKFRINRNVDDSVLDSDLSETVLNSVNITYNDEDYKQKLQADIELYTLLFDSYSTQYLYQKTKNSFLQKKLVDYYRKRKMFHVLKEAASEIETQKKYEKYLDKLQGITHNFESECARLVNESTASKAKKAYKQQQLIELRQNLLQLELTEGKDVVHNNAQGNLDKILEKHLTRQEHQMEYLTKVRLAYIKLRNKTSEKQAALNALDNLGSSLRLMDYEQLKVDNRNHRDKLEERDIELIELRNKCQNAMQILAHRREKIDEIEKNVAKLNEELERVNVEYEEVREHLNHVKRERDSIRNEITKMKVEAGLLNKPKLLQDMAVNSIETDELEEKVAKLKNAYAETSKLLQSLKKNLKSNELLELIKMRHKMNTNNVTLTPSALLATL